MTSVGHRSVQGYWARIDWYAVVGLLCVALSGFMSLYLVAHLVRAVWLW